MNKSNWKKICTSIIGAYHQKNNTPCQDASICETYETGNNESVLIAVVSDGAGSAIYGKEGAHLACNTCVTEIKKILSRKQEVILPKEAFDDLVTTIREKIKTEAENNNACLSDYACTILIVVAGEQNSYYYQTGDGAIVYSYTSSPDCYNLMFIPQKGEYENTTNFITDEVTYKKYDYVLEKKIDKVALFSDGLERLLLNCKDMTPHKPFFDSVFNYLSTSNETEMSKLAEPINQLLSSNATNKKTDDDKSLILAVRIDGISEENSDVIFTK